MEQQRICISPEFQRERDNETEGRLFEFLETMTKFQVILHLFKAEIKF